MSKKITLINPISMDEEVFLGLALAAAIGGGGWLWYKHGNPSVTLAPGTMAVKAKQGGTVTLKLPAGSGGWVGVANGSTTGGSLALASGTAPYPIPNVANGEIITASWKDASGSTQATTVTVATA